ncbi:MAG: trypsin-like serine protease [Rhodocyclaceae bacterium]|jgi:hypothetical protein|nr:trypsin-like serine protease [Rhodocyclaceae bacterium]
MRQTAKSTIATISFSLFSLATSCKSRIHNDSSPDSINTEIDERGEFSSVVAFETDDFFCSGTKVADNVLLTAAHCVDNLRTKGLDFVVRPGSRIGLTNQSKGPRQGNLLQFLTVRKVNVPESWKRMKETCDYASVKGGYCWIHNYVGVHDLALIETVESIEGVPASIPIAAEKVSSGERITIVGYGRYVTDAQIKKGNLSPWESFDRSRRVGYNIVADPKVIEIYKSMTSTYVTGVAEKIHETNIIVLSEMNARGQPMIVSSGDSGGPLIAETSGRREIIGVAAGGLTSLRNRLTVGQEYPPYMLFAKIDDDVFAWIRSSLSSAEAPSGFARNGIEFLRCDLDGQAMSTHLHNANGRIVLASLSTADGFQDAPITGLLEDDINTIFVSFEANAQLFWGKRSFKIHRMTLKRQHDQSKIGVSWHADAKLEVVEDGRNLVLTPDCSVIGPKGQLQRFFNSKGSLE